MSEMEPAYLLHRRPYANQGALVECLTLHHGRFPAIAKGIYRRGRSSNAAILQPFIPLNLKWSGKGEVKTLTGYEVEGRAIELRGKSLYCGFYINELLMRLLQRNDPHGQLFGIYSAALTQLSETTLHEPVLRYFEIELLEQLGYGLILDRDVESETPLIPDRVYYYQIEKGPIPSTKDMSGIILGKTLLSLNNNTQLDKQGTKEARELMRRILSFYLGDKPLKSRELFQTSFQKSI